MAAQFLQDVDQSGPGGGKLQGGLRRVLCLGGRKCLRDSGTKQHVSIHHSSVRRKVSLLYANNPCGKAVNALSFHSGLQVGILVLVCTEVV